ncbi:hypothetical protein BDB01DRAFT_833633 [Pilobolus umbonatus]|nr:hypothetical protein BDB01DRAFT_833633 [Pilobolus umbonatus]
MVMITAIPCLLAPDLFPHHFFLSSTFGVVNVVFIVLVFLYPKATRQYESQITNIPIVELYQDLTAAQRQNCVKPELLDLPPGSCIPCSQFFHSMTVVISDEY